MKKIFACLWQGEDLPSYSQDQYDLEYVDLLAKGVERHMPDTELVMLVDDTYWGAIRRRGAVKWVTWKFDGHGIGGWSNMLEVFRPNLWPEGDDRYMLIGLDTVLVGDCDWLFEWDKHPVGLPLDPFHAPIPCDAVVTWNREGAEIVWKAFLKSKKTGMKKHLLKGKPSEMQLLRDLFVAHKWQTLEREPKKLLSYKVHVAPRRSNEFMEASVVYFHGRPKPHQLPPTNPVRKAWVS